MKKIWLLVLIVFLLVSCSEADVNNNNNDFDDVETEYVDDFDYSVDIDFSNLPTPRMFEFTTPAPENEQTAYDEAYDLYYNSKNNEALEAFNAFITTYPNSVLASQADMMIGTTYRNMNEYEKAINKYKENIESFPNTLAAESSNYNIAHIYHFSLKDDVRAKWYYYQLINNVSLLNWRLYENSISTLARIEGITAPELPNPAFFLEGEFLVHYDSAGNYLYEPTEEDVFVANTLYDYFISGPEHTEEMYEKLFNELNIDTSYDDIRTYLGWVWHFNYR